MNDGISMVQIMDSTLDEVASIIQRMRDLAVQAANGSLTTTETAYLESEVDTLKTAVTNAGSGQVCCRYGHCRQRQIRKYQAGSVSGESISVSLSVANVSNITGLGLDHIRVTAAGVCNGVADTALDNVASMRATLGAGAQLSRQFNDVNVAENTAAAAVESWTQITLRRLRI